MSWTYCKTTLGEVSRTFSIPISMLRDELEVAVTCGYLLCRVVDTVEDEPDLPLAVRDELYAAFLDVLEQNAPTVHFVAAFDAAIPPRPDEPADRRLTRRLDAVMEVFYGLPDAHRTILRRWVAEMARGMAIYSRRPPGRNGVVSLTTVDDLERYCYFVAGTVGQLLTELFVDVLGPVDRTRHATLAANAEHFGLGLQLVNIIKDISDDLERDVTFVPTSTCLAAGLDPRELTNPAHRAAAHAAVRPLFESAERSLAAAFRYTLAIPAEAQDIRMFCLLPLWMAVATLELARDNDQLFVPGQPVKISREDVAAIIRGCGEHCQNDAALVETFQHLAAPAL